MSKTADHVLQRLEALVGADQVRTLPPWAPSSQETLEIPIAYPRDEGQARELLRLAESDGLHVLPTGAGTKIALEAPRESAHFLIGTEHLCGIIEFEPADGTLTAWAGTPMRELSQLAAEGGRRVTPQLAHTSATLGGAIATAQTGDDRLRYGPLRDQLLGLRALLSAEISSQSGGRLVKNVAGYDLHRAHCGGRGRFGLILEATLRLHPALGAELHIESEVADLQAGIALAKRILASTARPLNVRVVETAQTILRVHLGGREDVVEDELRTMSAICSSFAPAAPLQFGAPVFRACSLRSQAENLAAWSSMIRDGLELETTLVVEPGIASASLIPSAPIARRLVSSQLPNIPQGIDVVLPTEVPTGLSTGVLALQGAVRKALDPKGLFAN